MPGPLDSFGTEKKLSSSGVVWDLTPLFPDHVAAIAAAQDSLKDAEALAQKYRRTKVRGAVAWRKLFTEIDAVELPLSRAYEYAYLLQAAETGSESARDLTNSIRDLADQVSLALAPLYERWRRLPIEQVSQLVRQPELKPDAFSLKRMRVQSRYSLGDARSEEIYQASSIPVANWVALHNELSAQVVRVKGLPKPERLGQLATLASHPVRDIRFMAEKTRIEAMVPHVLPASYCYDSLVAWRIADAKLRGISDPLQLSRMSYGVEKAVLDLALDAAEAAYPQVQNWWQKKRDLLKLKTFRVSDTSAPIGELPKPSFYDARLTMLEAFGKFSPEYAELARGLFLNRRIDAEPRNGKQSGAFCMSIEGGGLPYLLMNYQDDFDSMKTLAHESGHAVHHILGNRDQSPLSSHPSLLVAEIASTFAEGLLFNHLIESEPSLERRRAFTGWRIDRIINTVIRQATFARFEERAYAGRKAGEALTARRLSGIWTEVNRDLYGTGIEIPENFEHSWASVGHFIKSRYYTPSYTFAGLCSLLLLRRLKEDPAAFTPRFLAMLSAGGSMPTAPLLKMVGIAVNQAQTWKDAVCELDILMRNVVGPDGAVEAA